VSGATLRRLLLACGLLATSGCERRAFVDLWLTPDQQGRRAWEAGDYATAAERFEDPLWRGLAAYRAGDLERAVDLLAQADSAEAWFDLGVVQARLGRYAPAADAWRQALERRPGWAEAAANLALVEGLIAAAEQEPPPSDEPGGDPHYDPDEVKVDERGKQGKPGEVPLEQLSDAEVSELWLRRLSTSPRDFLRRKFAIQAEQQGEER